MSHSDATGQASAGLDGLRSILAPRQDEIVGNVQSLANRWSYFFRRERNLERWHSVRGAYTLYPKADLVALREATALINSHHDGLRLQGAMTPSGWKETIVSSAASSPFLHINTTYQSETITTISAVAKEVQELSAFPGGLFHVVYLQTPSEHLLAFFFHHLLVDEYSIALVVEDFFKVYDQLVASGRARLPQKTTAFLSFSCASTLYWSQRAEGEAKIWHSYEWERVKSLIPTSLLDKTQNIEQHTIELRATLPIKFHYLLELQRQRGWRPAEIFLAAVARAYARWCGHSLLHLALVAHGRESFLAEVNLSRTVGWISETVPVLLDGDQPWITLLANSQKELRKVSVRGRGYGVLRYLKPEQHAIDRHPHPEISLNIRSNIRSVSTLSTNFVRDAKHRIQLPQARSTGRVFILSGGIFSSSSGDVILAWDFSNRILDEKRVNHFLQACVLSLRELVSYVSDSANGQIND